ncbi:CopG family transcriptional regulator [Nostoc sp. FACHB-133]|uniref:CopG family transcriptional regulator n=1 Tax=Nostoc sp. FACHB-133 TaxID=2692835 RepID=UPI001689C145|nr:CopG family transcriptional regulator [Nostoc sp. FACHB-133]MBD2527277.1 CopG family transcriptional regulator [Nostoc sp. FACHB-133]
MTNKKRKSLDDALAREFVYGESAKEQDLSPQVTANPKNQTEVEEQQQAETHSQIEPEPELEPIATSIPTHKLTKPSIMSQLQPTAPKEATIRLTVDLPESMHQKLSLLAAKTRRKKAEIVRLLLDEALKDVNE